MPPLLAAVMLSDATNGFFMVEPWGRVALVSMFAAGHLEHFTQVFDIAGGETVLQKWW